MKITFHGHSCFIIEENSKTIAIDPFITGNPLAKISADQLNPDAILVTHAHADHLGDTIEIAKRTGALVVSVFELVGYCQSKGVENAHPLHIGGGADFDFGYVKLTIAHHGSGTDDGEIGNPAGVLLTIGDKTIYHAGDTGLFLDMKLIGEMNNITAALLPIGGNFTMDTKDALKAVEFLKPQIAIPMHYKTWPPIDTNPEDFIKGLDGTGVEGKIISVGESIEI